MFKKKTSIAELVANLKRENYKRKNWKCNEENF